jgi:hypothetical protein
MTLDPEHWTLPDHDNIKHILCQAVKPGAALKSSAIKCDYTENATVVTVASESVGGGTGTESISIHIPGLLLPLARLPADGEPSFIEVVRELQPCELKQAKQKPTSTTSGSGNSGISGGSCDSQFSGLIAWDDSLGLESGDGDADQSYADAVASLSAPSNLKASLFRHLLK